MNLRTCLNHFYTVFHKVTFCVRTCKTMLWQNIAILSLRMVKRVQIALNIEFEVLFKLLVHYFSRFHIFHTNIQKNVATKYTYVKALNGRTYINRLKCRIWDLIWIICAQFFMYLHFAYEHVKRGCDWIHLFHNLEW